MRISSGLSGALQENMYDEITVLGTISEGRFFRVLKARMGTKHIILKSAVHKDAMTTEFLRREFQLGITPSLKRAIAHRRYLPSPSHPTMLSKTA